MANPSWVERVAGGEWDGGRAGRDEVEGRVGTKAEGETAARGGEEPPQGSRELMLTRRPFRRSPFNLYIGHHFKNQIAQANWLTLTRSGWV